MSGHNRCASTQGHNKIALRASLRSKDFDTDPTHKMM